MNCNVGVSIGTNVQWVANRVQKSAGMRLMSASEAQAKSYYPGAAVPEAQWSAVGEEISVERGIACFLKSPHEQVGIVNIGTAHTAELLQVVLHNEKSTQPDREKERRLTLALEEHLSRSFFKDDGSLYCHGVIGKRPGLETVTIDTTTGLSPGMHLDSWDKNAARAEETRIRLNVNLGPEPRYFLFLGKNIVHINNAVEEGSFVPEGQNTLYYQYLARHRAAPVFRIQVMPGEAYLAATDCIIHDASTLDGTADVYTLQVRGNLDNAAPGLEL